MRMLLRPIPRMYSILHELVSQRATREPHAPRGFRLSTVRGMQGTQNQVSFDAFQDNG